MQSVRHDATGDADSLSASCIANGVNLNKIHSIRSFAEGFLLKFFANSFRVLFFFEF
jgi:hypothetical protein